MVIYNLNNVSVTSGGSIQIIDNLMSNDPNAALSANMGRELKGMIDNIELTPGPAGPQGPQGPQGEAGPIGPQGEKGENGAPGEKGEQGPQGEKGDKGDPGEKGEQGPIGPQGPQGPAGSGGGGGGSQDPVTTLVAITNLKDPHLYFNTSYVPTNSTRVELVMSMGDKTNAPQSNWGAFFGIGDGSNHFRFTDQGSDRLCFQTESGTIDMGVLDSSINSIHTYALGNCYFEYDNKISALTKYDVNWSEKNPPLFAFAMVDEDNIPNPREYSSRWLYVYSIKILEGTEIKRNYVPVKFDDGTFGFRCSMTNHELYPNGTADGVYVTETPMSACIDNLNSVSTNLPLSANMGRVLQNTKQDKLIPGESFKTVGGESLFGSGDIYIPNPLYLSNDNWNDQVRDYYNRCKIDQRPNLALLGVAETSDSELYRYEYPDYGVFIPAEYGQQDNVDHVWFFKLRTEDNVNFDLWQYKIYDRHVWIGKVCTGTYSDCYQKLLETQQKARIYFQKFNIGILIGPDQHNPNNRQYRLSEDKATIEFYTSANTWKDIAEIDDLTGTDLDKPEAKFIGQIFKKDNVYYELDISYNKSMLCSTNPTGNHGGLAEQTVLACPNFLSISWNSRDALHHTGYCYEGIQPCHFNQVIPNGGTKGAAYSFSADFRDLKTASYYTGKKYGDFYMCDTTFNGLSRFYYFLTPEGNTKLVNLHCSLLKSGKINSKEQTFNASTQWAPYHENDIRFIPDLPFKKPVTKTHPTSGRTYTEWTSTFIFKVFSRDGYTFFLDDISRYTGDSDNRVSVFDYNRGTGWGFRYRFDTPTKKWYVDMNKISQVRWLDTDEELDTEATKAQVFVVQCWNSNYNNSVGYPLENIRVKLYDEATDTLSEVYYETSPLTGVYSTIFPPASTNAFAIMGNNNMMNLRPFWFAYSESNLTDDQIREAIKYENAVRICSYTDDNGVVDSGAGYVEPNRAFYIGYNDQIRFMNYADISYRMSTGVFVDNTPLICSDLKKGWRAKWDGDNSFIIQDDAELNNKLN